MAKAAPKAAITKIPRPQIKAKYSGFSTNCMKRVVKVNPLMSVEGPPVAVAAALTLLGDPRESISEGGELQLGRLTWSSLGSSTPATAGG